MRPVSCRVVAEPFDTAVGVGAGHDVAQPLRHTDQITQQGLTVVRRPQVVDIADSGIPCETGV